MKGDDGRLCAMKRHTVMMNSASSRVQTQDLVIRSQEHLPLNLDWLQSPVTKYFSYNPVW